MLPDDTQNKIKNITGGNVIEGSEDNCTTVRNLLCRSFATSTTVEIDFEGQSIVKEKQERLLEEFAFQTAFGTMKLLAAVLNQPFIAVTGRAYQILFSKYGTPSFATPSSCCQ